MSAYGCRTGKDIILNDVLIEEVKARPVLYDKSLKSYNDLSVKRSAWEEIYVKLYPDTWEEMSDTERDIRGTEVIKRWNNLRTCFTRELKIMKDPLQSKTRKYIYFNQLLFLLDQSSNIPEAEATCVFAKKSLSDKFEYESDKSTNESKTKEIRKKKKPRKEKSKKQVSAYIVKYVQQSINQMKEELTLKNRNDDVSMEHVPKPYETDADTNFALSIVPMLKTIPHNKKIDAHIELLSVLKKYRNQADYGVVKYEKEDVETTEDEADNNDSDVLSTSMFVDDN